MANTSLFISGEPIYLGLRLTAIPLKSLESMLISVGVMAFLIAMVTPTWLFSIVLE